MHNHKRRGFTLVELIIVIIILGILAALAMPQFVTSTDDAKTATVAANLAIMRNAIQLYYHQHNSTYPGENKADGTTASTAAEQAEAFAEQLTSFTNEDGEYLAWDSDRDNYPYGPYVQNGIPENPLKNNSREVKVVEGAVDVTDGGTEGWQFSITDGTFVSYVP